MADLIERLRAHADEYQFAELIDPERRQKMLDLREAADTLAARDQSLAELVAADCEYDEALTSQQLIPFDRFEAARTRRQAAIRAAMAKEKGNG